MKPLYIIDFSNWAYKYKSTYSWAHIDVNGVNIDTSVLTGFTYSLKNLPFKDICIVLDGIPQQSLSILPNYKGTRNHDDPSQSIPVPKLEVIQYLTQVGAVLDKNISVVCSPLQETDQVIASIVLSIIGNLPKNASFKSRLMQRSLESDNMLKYLAKGNPDLTIISDFSKFDAAIIASTDGDFIQLQRFPSVYIDTSVSGKNITNCHTSKTTSDLSPIVSIPYKAIYGDVSDNIPSCNLPFKKSTIFKVLEEITDDDALIKFYDAVATDSSASTPRLQKLAIAIKRYNKSQFLINWSVAYLEFMSFPNKVTFPHYSLQTTISKYNLNVHSKVY